LIIKNKTNQIHDDEVYDLIKTVLESPGVTENTVRKELFSNKNIPESLTKYAGKIRNESYRISDYDIKELLASGYSEDAIFEITVSTSLGAASERLNIGLNALKEALNEA
jgi:hypothetical protein